MAKNEKEIIYSVKQGDTIQSIAKQFGVDAKKIIEDNQKKFKEGLNQYILYPGENAYKAAEKRLKGYMQKPMEFVIKITEEAGKQVDTQKKNIAKILDEPALDLILEANNKPLKNTDFILVLNCSEKKIISGKTDSKGQLVNSNWAKSKIKIPLDTIDAKLYVKELPLSNVKKGFRFKNPFSKNPNKESKSTDPSDPYEHYPYIFNLKLNNLDPINTISGIQARLQNLYIYLGQINDSFNAETEAAVNLFLALYKKQTEPKKFEKIEDLLNEISNLLKKMHGC